MIITKTPYRISFFGGGSDFPLYYSKFGGCVIGSTINKYCYISLRELPPFFKNRHRIVWSEIQLPNTISEIKHPCIKGVLNYFKIKNGVEIHHQGDLPAFSGIGSSSSFSVGLINALMTSMERKLDKKELGKLSLYIEQKILKEHVGSQDQMWASYGGMNFINFNKKSINVKKLSISEKNKKKLSNNLILFFTGKARFSGKIEKNKIFRIEKNLSTLEEMKNYVFYCKKILEKGSSLDEFGELLDNYWNLKKELSNEVSSNLIDEIYKEAKISGAKGGKIIGAGGGGFILFYAKPEVQKKLIKKFNKLTPVRFDFSAEGSKVIFRQKEIKKL
jgi:D-glycero-alpha-D-manno-heptose-7-phosphate kinase